MPDGAPEFVISHEIEIDGSAEQTWAVLCDVERFGDWNPYVLHLEGSLVAGATLRVTITQRNWPEPLVVEPTVIRAEPGHVLHWRGQVGDGGVLDTDHVFEIEALDGGRVRFHQYEEFRGSLAAGLEAQSRTFTTEAFRAMNEALATRVRSLDL